MRRFLVGDVTEPHYRQLRLLVAIGRAEAYLVVRCATPWPRAVERPALNSITVPKGDAIN
jgi:hypothetical protein